MFVNAFIGFFLASFALGERAVRAARRSGFPKRVAKIIDEAGKHAEGTAVRFEVKNTGDVDIVKRLAAIKMDN